MPKGFRRGFLLLTVEAELAKKSLQDLGSEIDLILDRFEGYDEPAKKQFIRNARTFLKRYAVEVLKLKEQGIGYEVRVNKAGIAVTGEVTLHADDIYIQISGSALKHLGHVLYRRCDSRTDYTGHRNFYMTVQLTARHNLRENVGCPVHKGTFKEIRQ
jgi:hypothetical protein